MQTAPAPTAPIRTPDFADVYGEQLPAVWRFVRSRIWDTVEAQDVTSEVFVRAWRSWHRFDPARGPVEPWLFTIAARTVTDWWRRQRPEPVDHTLMAETVATTDRAPDADVLRDELLRQLATAMDRLDDREREGLALRFAARLSSRHVARVLGVSPEAAKQLLHRAVGKLRRLDVAAQAADVAPADLDGVVDDLLAGNGAHDIDVELRELLVHMAAIHDEPMPADLPEQVGDCIACAARDEDEALDGASGELASAGGFVAGVFGLAPVCLACVLPAAHSLMGMIGLGAVAFYFHLAAPLVAVLATWLMARAARRHGHRAGVRLAIAGSALLVLHLVAHDPWTDYAGLALLGTGAIVNAAQVRQWRREQQRRFALRAATGQVTVG